jgi:hypothetical protein
MTTELANRPNGNVALYRAEEDGFSSFAAEGAPGIKGKRLSFTKGDYSVGGRDDKVPAPQGARYLVIMPDIMRGVVKWGEHGISDAHVGRVSECYRQPHRNTLGDTDQSLWAVGKDGKPRDPWQRYLSAHLVELAVPHGSLTFVGSSWGMQSCIQAICNDYVDARHEHEGHYPVVKLAVHNKQHKDFGVVKEPRLEIVGWARLEDVRAGRKAAAGIAAPVSAATKAKAAAKAGVAPMPEEPPQLEPTGEPVGDDVSWN